MTPKEKTGRYKYIRYIICYGVLSLLFLIFFLWNINAGSVDLSVKEIAEILFFHSGDEMEYGIVWKIRLPRIIAAAVLGGAFSAGGISDADFFPQSHRRAVCLGNFLRREDDGGSDHDLSAEAGTGVFIVGALYPRLPVP